MRPRSWVGAALVAAVAVVVVAGCSTPPWQTSPSSSTTAGSGAPSAGVSASAGSTASGRASATPAGSPAPSSAAPSAGPTGSTGSGVTNDLATGSAHRTVTAGAITLKINYWSTLDMGQWTPQANKPLTLSLSASLPQSTKQGVYLTKVTVSPSLSAADQSVAGPEPLVDKTSVSPGYLILKPSSYQQVFVLPAVDPATTSMALTITYEMLLQTTPTSKQYARLTASDSLTVTLA